MGEDVRLEVGGLGKLLVAAVKRTDVRPVSRVDADVGAQVEVQRETLSAAFERALWGDGERISTMCTSSPEPPTEINSRDKVVVPLDETRGTG